KLDLEETQFNLFDPLAVTLKTLALRAHEKDVELSCHMELDVPPVLIGDSGRLRQILFNLLGNAIKFTQHGEIVVRVSREWSTTEHVCLHFSITDTGIGISLEQQGKIFDAFTQADGSA